MNGFHSWTWTQVYKLSWKYGSSKNNGDLERSLSAIVRRTKRAICRDNFSSTGLMLFFCTRVYVGYYKFSFIATSRIPIQRYINLRFFKIVGRGCGLVCPNHYNARYQLNGMENALPSSASLCITHTAYIVLFSYADVPAFALDLGLRTLWTLDYD